MTCTCHPLNPWRRLGESAEPSIFATDPAFTVGAKTGKTQSQIASKANVAFEQKHGYSLGTIGGISPEADRLNAQRQFYRRRQMAQEK